MRWSGTRATWTMPPVDGVSAEEIEQAISNAVEFRRSKHQSDRRRIEARTDEGRNLVVIIQLLGSRRARPITAWEAT